jgi:hypothetical protein
MSLDKLKVAYFCPVVVAVDQVPPVEFSKIYTMCEELHENPPSNDADNNPFISARGGQQVQVYPNKVDLNVEWLVKWLENVCRGYMELITKQSGAEDLLLCDPVVTSIWTIRQKQGDYQEMHSHPAGNISGNIYISIPHLDDDSHDSDCQIQFRLPQTRDVTKFIMQDTWKFTPIPGSMILFPSYLPHTVYPWKGKGHRTSLAFDARLVPKEETIQQLAAQNGIA